MISPASIFFLLGTVSFVVFLLTLAWHIASRFSLAKEQQTETVVVKPAQEEWDPFKHIAERAGEEPSDVNALSPTDSGKPLQASPPPTPRIELPLETSPSIKNEPPGKKEISLKEEPVAEEPGQTQSIELEDPWKALMKDAAKKAPLSKSKEIPLEFDSSDNEDEKK